MGVVGVVGLERLVVVLHAELGEQPAAERGEARVTRERRSPRSIRMSEETMPSTSTMTRSASTIASSTSWVTSRTDGLVRGAQLLEQDVHPDPGQGVERPERLIASSELGSRTSDRARAARCCSPPEALRPGLLAAGQADLGQRLLGRARGALARSARADVVEDPAPRQQPGVLEDHRHPGGYVMDPCPATSRSSPARARRSVLLPRPLRPRGHELALRISRSSPFRMPPACRSRGEALDPTAVRVVSCPAWPPCQCLPLEESDEAVGRQPEQGRRRRGRP